MHHERMITAIYLVPCAKDVSKRWTAAQILKHDWLVKEGVALDVSLDSVVIGRMKHFAQANKLKKMCLMVVGQHLSLDEITGQGDQSCRLRCHSMNLMLSSFLSKGLKELFKSIDEDGSGTITLEEMRRSLTKWEHKITDAELTSLMSVADVDGDGLIDYNEFVAATMQMSKLEQEELVQKAFKQLDK